MVLDMNRAQANRPTETVTIEASKFVKELAILADKRAQELGLPKGSTWDDIAAHNSKELALVKAAELGLNPDSNWAEILGTKFATTSSDTKRLHV